MATSKTPAAGPHAANQERGNGAHTITHDFFSTLFGDKDGAHFLTVAAFKPDEFLHTQCIDTAVEAVARLTSQQRNAYYSLGLQGRQLSTREKGGADDVVALTCAWLDVDVLHPAHAAKNLPPTPQDARRIITLFPIPPGFLIWSGHGWQALWPFKEPWLITSSEEKQVARALLRRFQRLFRMRAMEQWQWLVDPTANLDRVFRAPGSVNWKNSRHPVPVEVVERIDTRIDPAEIAALLDELAVPTVEAEAHEYKRGDFPPADVEQIVRACAWLRHCRDEARTLPEPEWYAAAGVVGRCTDGARIFHKWSTPHPNYLYEETVRKLTHALTSAGPRTCKSIYYDLGGKPFCSQCPAWVNGIKSPIVLGWPDPQQKKAEALEQLKQKRDAARQAAVELAQQRRAAALALSQALRAK